MLDINLLRTDKGGNPELIRESQRSRNAKVELVDEVIELDRAWIKCKRVIRCIYTKSHLVRFDLDALNKEFNAVQKEIGQKMKNKESPGDLLDKKKNIENKRTELKKIVDEKEKERDSRLILIGNVVHNSVPISGDEVG